MSGRVLDVAVDVDDGNTGRVTKVRLKGERGVRSRRRYTDRRQAYTTGAMIQRRRARARHRNLDKEDNSISGMRWVEDLFRGSFHIVSGSSSGRFVARR